MAFGWTLLIQRSLLFTCFWFVRLLFTFVQRIYWELNGTGRRIRECTDPQYYERSAQVLDVVMKYHVCELRARYVEDFICVHNRFENPQFVIDNEHVTLLTITDKNAVFVAAKDKGVRFWKSEISSFITMAQSMYSKQLIVVPLAVFHQMAQKIGDPKIDLIFVYNTARCGSTLFKQIMECTGRCIATSGPNTPTLVATKYMKEGDTPEVRQLARDVIRWECRPYPSMQPPPLAYVLKIRAAASVGIPLFSALFPKSRNLFMYRDIITVSKSLYRLACNNPTMFMAMKLGRLSGAITKSAVDAMGWYGGDYRYRIQHDLDFGIIMTGTLMRAYLNARTAGNIDIVGFRYEDVIDDPHESIRRILEHCRLPVELVEQAVRGLAVDAQKNSTFAKSIIGSLNEPELTPESITRVNGMLKRYGVPLIGEDFVVDGTITYQRGCSAKTSLSSG